MAQDIFLKFNGIEGEAQYVVHKGDVDVLRWDWLVSQPANMQVGR